MWYQCNTVVREVALRKESVDRNFCSEWAKTLFR